MKAIIHRRYGPPEEALELGDVDTPAPQDGEVLLGVRSAGVCRGDWLIAVGQPYIARPSYGLRGPKHHVAGMEVAGIVEAASPRAAFEEGDEVFGWCSGAFAEHVAVSQTQLARKPPNVSFEQAAAVPVSGFAALQAVRDSGAVRPGQDVLVIGASGGVGSMAVQIAKAYGARVTGVCSTGNVDLVSSLGADEVIDYTRDEITVGGRRFDVIIDIAGNRPVRTIRRALTPDGTVVIVGGTGGPVTMGFGRTVGAMVLSPFVGQRLRSLLSKPNEADLNALRELINASSLFPIVDRTYALAEAPKAVSELGAGRSRGKRVVRVEAE